MSTANGNGRIVEVKNVVKSFPVGDGEITILKGISFDVKSGEFLPKLVEALKTAKSAE